MSTDEEVAWCAKLRESVTALQDSVDAARSFDHVRLPADGPVSAADVVEYAWRISYTTFAPAGYQPGAPLHGIMPPAPQDEHFAASHLAAHAAQAKQREEARKARETAAEEARKAAKRGEMPPIETVISLLSTWKPGQPWPAGIPAPPPGWKPGDPLHLGAPKPKDGAEGAKASDGKKQAAATTHVVPAAVTAPPRAHKPDKPAMPKVPFVKIDLHSDSDEFEEVSASDYSSDSD
jgi:hypothetical protein